MAALLVSFFTLFAFDAWWQSQSIGLLFYNDRSYRFSLPFCLFCSAMSVGIYRPMVAWMSLWIGLKARTQARANIGALGAIVGWRVLPYLFWVTSLAILSPSCGRSESRELPSMLLSPASIIVLNEFNGRSDFGGFKSAAIIGNFLCYGIALFIFRSQCLNQAGRLLGRSEGH